jgi:hypothetical protein
MQGLISPRAIDNALRAEDAPVPSLPWRSRHHSTLQSFDLRPSGVVRALSVRCSHLQLGNSRLSRPKTSLISQPSKTLSCFHPGDLSPSPLVGNSAPLNSSDGLHSGGTPNVTCNTCRTCGRTSVQKENMHAHDNLVSFPLPLLLPLHRTALHRSHNEANVTQSLCTIGECTEQLRDSGVSPSLVVQRCS